MFWKLGRGNFVLVIGAGLAWLLLGVSTGVSAQQLSKSQPPQYKPLRYDEDYSYLKDPSLRTDFWDPIKYIPLGSSDGWYLSLGGELRVRYEFFHNEEAGGQPADSHAQQ